MAPQIRDAAARDVEAITRIQNALIASTTVEWTDEPYTVDGRRRWLDLVLMVRLLPGDPPA